MLENPKDNGCNHIDISARISQNDSVMEFNFDELVPVAEQPNESELEKYTEYAQIHNKTQGMDALPLDLFDKMLNNCLCRKDYRSVFWLVCMANMGLRYSDVVKFRRIDFIDKNNRIKDSILVQEKKTSKQRIVFVNKAIKEALLLLLWNTDIAPMDYLITSNANRKGYEIEMYINDKGQKRAKRINGKFIYKLDENGNKIPKPLSRCQSEVIMKKIIVENLGVALKNDWRCKDSEDAIGNICTHSIRKLYGKAVTDDFITQFDSDEAYAHTAALRFLSQDYGHSTEAMTLRYSKDFEQLKKTIVMRINLGLNVLEPYFQKEAVNYMAHKS